MQRLFSRFVFFLSVVCLSLVASCSGDDAPEAQDSERTVLVFMPWTGSSSNLLSFFRTNIDDMKKAMEQGSVGGGDRIVVFLAESASSARMFELTMNGGKCVERNLKSYSNLNVTQSSGIRSVLTDAAGFAPARSYSMIVGGHGVGWVRAGSFGSDAKLHRAKRAEAQGGAPLTRFFGGFTAGSMIDIETLADGIKAAGMKMEYILFDDCYMSNVEVAFCLKDATRYLIACPAEMMNYGMPYRNILRCLTGTPDYAAVCSELVSFYNSYTYMGRKYPYATIAVTDCSQLDALASLMRRVNAVAKVDADMQGVQVFDGYSPSLFFDLGDYVRHVCTDESLLSAFSQQLAAAVPYKDNTPYYFSALIGMNGEARKITEFSGITVSDPSRNSLARDKQTTAWWRATHRSEQ